MALEVTVCAQSEAMIATVLYRRTENGIVIVHSFVAAFTSSLQLSSAEKPNFKIAQNKKMFGLWAVALM